MQTASDHSSQMISADPFAIVTNASGSFPQTLIFICLSDRHFSTRLAVVGAHPEPAAHHWISRVDSCPLFSWILLSRCSFILPPPPPLPPSISRGTSLSEYSAPSSSWRAVEVSNFPRVRKSNFGAEQPVATGCAKARSPFRPFSAASRRQSFRLFPVDVSHRPASAKLLPTPSASRLPRVLPARSSPFP